MTPDLNLIELSEEPRLLGSAAYPGGRRESWFSWDVHRKAVFGLPMDERGLAVFRDCTGLDRPPERPFREAWTIVGRRGGKSYSMAVVAVYLGLFRDYKKYLSPGERGVIQIIAADRQQARVNLRYISGILSGNPVLHQYVKKESAEYIELSTGVDIQVATCSYRSIRGRTLVAAICDEIAFWRVDGANPDSEILSAIRPSMATIPNSLLLVISTPYAKNGVLWEAYRGYYGIADPNILVWKAPTRTMNPNISKEFIEREMKKDPAAALAEYGFDFRADIESAFSREPVEACVVPGRYELPPIPGERYFAFVDPSGGVRDSFTLAISHIEKTTGRRILDVLREYKAPFNPSWANEDSSKEVKRYWCTSVTGDKYAGEYPREQFRKHGITYKIEKKSKSDIYRDFLPLINSGEIELLDNSRLINQICSLERRTARSGKDSIDHPPKGMDDLANAAAGALVGVAVRRKRGGVWGSEYVARRGSDRKRPPLALIADAHLVVAHEERKRLRKRRKLDSFTDAVLSGRARIVKRD